MENIVFELDGKSFEAAEMLSILTRIRTHDRKPKNSGNMGEIMKSWQAFYEQFLADLEIENPDILKDTGLTSPSLVIKEKKYSAPRAYLEYPAIFIAPLKKLKMYMYVPVAHDGSHFVPEGARKLDAEETAKVGDLLFAGGWLGNAPVFERKAEGCELPNGFVRTPHSDLKNSYVSVTFNYLASGQTLEAVDRYIKAQKQYDEVIRQIFDKTQDIVNEISGGQEKINMGYSESKSDIPNGLTGLEIGLGHGPMQIENKYFNTSYVSGRTYVVLRSDTDEGRKYAKLFENVTRPQMKDFVGIDADNMCLFDHQDMRFIQFTSPVKTPPADCTPVSRELVQWLKDDGGDIRTGITPPPMPKELSIELAALRNLKRGKNGPAPK